MTRLEWIQELKLLLVVYFLTIFTLATFSQECVSSFTLEEAFAILLSAFGSMGISPLTNMLLAICSSTYSSYFINFEIIMTSLIISSLTTLGTMSAIIAFVLVAHALKITSMPQKSLRIALILGIAIIALDILKAPTMIYSIIPSVLAICISLREERVKLLGRVVTVLLTIIISLLTGTFLGALIKNSMLLLCIIPLVSLIFLKSEGKKELSVVHEKSETSREVKGKTKKENLDEERECRKRVYVVKLIS